MNNICAHETSLRSLQRPTTLAIRCAETEPRKTLKHSISHGAQSKPLNTSVRQARARATTAYSSCEPVRCARAGSRGP